MPDVEDLRVRHLLDAVNHLEEGGGPVAEASRVLATAVAGPRLTGRTVVSPVASRAVVANPAVNAITVAPAASNGTWGRRTLLQNLPSDKVQRAKWEIAKVPRFEIEPAPTLGTPRREGDYLLWNDAGRGRIYFALATPRLLDVMVTIRRESADGTVKITGGSVTLTVSAYDRVGPQIAQRLQDGWLAAVNSKTVLDRSPAREVMTPLAPRSARPVDTEPIIVKPKGPVGSVHPSYFPLVLRGLEASLETDPAFVAGTISVVTSPDVGTVSFLIPLSELGAQAWKDALEQRRGDLIAGICRLTARYYATAGTNLTVQPIQLSATLGSLLAGRGTEIMQVLNAQITVDARVIVSGHQTLETVTIDWRPNEGHAPESLAFGPDGGSFNGPITSQDFSQVTIDWSAQIRFKPPSWPIITRRGQLSFAGGDWTLMLKPESWVTEYALFVVLLDAAGEPISQAVSAADPSHRATCEVRFTAPFLEGGAAVTSAFEMTSQTLTRVAFPLPPGETPGEVKLTVFAQRGAATNLKARLLQPSESFVIITVYANANVDFTVNAPEGGDTIEGTLLEIASQLG